MIKFVRIASAILLIFWMTLIFCLSHQTAEESTETSGGIIEVAVKLMEPEYDSLSEEEQEALITPFQFVVRKLAHFSIYAILGFLAFLSIGTYRISLFARFFFSSLISLLYAMSDEYHQLYIDGRSGELRDIVIDFCGSLISILFVVIVVRLNKKGMINKLFCGGEILDMEEFNILNSELANQLELSKEAIGQLKAENSELKAIIEQLKGKVDSALTVKEASETELSEPQPTEQIIVAENNSQNTVSAELSDDMSYGASAIGKIVVSAAKHCNRLTAKGSSDTVKELINLILGRTEVAKSDILNIICSEDTLETKKELIDKEKIYAEDYFCSVLAQTE